MQIAHNAEEFAAYYSDAAAALNDAEEHERAEAACRAALEQCPGHWAALANLGAALHRQFRYPEAISAYIAAAANNPTRFR